jgi:hypothetical protein
MNPDPHKVKGSVVNLDPDPDTDCIYFSIVPMIVYAYSKQYYTMFYQVYHDLLFEKFEI